VRILADSHDPRGEDLRPLLLEGAAPPTPTSLDPELDEARADPDRATCRGCRSRDVLVARAQKPGPDQGRLFRRCADCGKFEWLGLAVASAPAGDAELAAAQRDAGACPRCAQARIARRVRKEGANHGRLFLTCSDPACNSFEWLGSAPPSAPGDP